MKHQIITKREFLKRSVTLGSSGILGFSILSGCGKEKEKGEEDVAPAEDLMREHGLLNRILLIYDTCHQHLTSGSSFPFDALTNSATIIRTFIEDYHEKLEEDHLFPRFEKANKLTDLVNTLRIQHQAGRQITDQIIQISKNTQASSEEHQTLASLLKKFNTMYRPHEAREDTVLFPALRTIISKHEYDSLGEDFEKKEHELFGENGFESMVEKVATIERQLNIFDLSKFTPQ